MNRWPSAEVKKKPRPKMKEDEQAVLVLSNVLVSDTKGNDYDMPSMISERNFTSKSIFLNQHIQQFYIVSVCCNNGVVFKIKTFHTNTVQQLAKEIEMNFFHYTTDPPLIIQIFNESITPLIFENTVESSLKRGESIFVIGIEQFEQNEQFDHLSQILKNKISLTVFAQFCLQEFCIENLLFYLEVCGYQAGSFQFADYLYKKYLVKDAPLKLNLITDIHDDIVSYLYGGNAGADLFETAQNCAFAILKEITLPRFKSDLLFINLVQQKKADPALFFKSTIDTFKMDGKCCEVQGESLGVLEETINKFLPDLSNVCNDLIESYFSITKKKQKEKEVRQSLMAKVADQHNRNVVSNDIIISHWLNCDTIILSNEDIDEFFRPPPSPHQLSLRRKTERLSHLNQLQKDALEILEEIQKEKFVERDVVESHKRKMGLDKIMLKAARILAKNTTIEQNGGEKRMLDDRVNKMKALLSKLKSSEIMKSKRKEAIKISSSENSLNKSTDIKAKTAIKNGTTIKPFALS